METMEECRATLYPTFYRTKYNLARALVSFTLMSERIGVFTKYAAGTAE